MKDKLDLFTSRAKRVLSLAQEEARRLRHNYIGTEHLLLGLMMEEKCAASKVLRNLGLDPRQVQMMVERISEPGRYTFLGKINLTPRTKRVIELAVDEAKKMGHHYIGTEHLLLGLVKEGEGVAIEVLKHLGISPERVQEEATKVMMENPIYSERRRSRRRTPLIDQIGIDLTAMAEQGKLDPVIGRRKEIERVIQILSLIHI